METKENANHIHKERGITLVALIITIIILVILAAVSISVVYQSKMVEYGIQGAVGYTNEAKRENDIIKGTENIVESAIRRIDEIIGGNTETGGEEPTEPEQPTPEESAGKTKEELSADGMIGKYVNYEPTGTDYLVEGKYSGKTEGGRDNYVEWTNETTPPINRVDETFSPTLGMKWRIWGVEGDNLLLISETVGNTIELCGSDGYNNAVKILNDACSTAYSSNKYGNGAVTARSINQEDIDKITNMTTDEQRMKAASEYGGTWTPDTYKKWPNIYGQESSKTGGGSLGRSEQSSWYQGITEQNFTGKYTYYYYPIANYGTNDMYKALITNPTADSKVGSTLHSTYWSASHCVNFVRSSAGFRVFLVDSGIVNAYLLCNSFGDPRSIAYSVRPMVSINLNLVKIGVTGEGERDNAYSMERIEL